MNVLHCFKVYQPDQNGGIEEAISQATRSTPSRSNASILVCRSQGWGSSLAVDGISVERTSTFGQVSSVPVSPTYIWRLHQRLQSTDVLAFHAPFPLVDLAIRLGFLRNDQALVVHWHAEIVGRNLVRPLFAPLLDYSVERADRIIVSDPAIVDRSPYLRRVREKCTVIPYGIDTAEWLPLDGAPAAINDVRRRYPKLIVACGRLVPYKGFEVLLRAMTRVDGQLVIVGKGPLQRHLERLIDELGLEDRVSLAGFLTRHDQRRLYHAARAFVLPSVSEAEAFGIAQVEAMACGLPVVNTSLSTGVPFVARNEQEAITVSPGNSEELSAAIQRLIDNPDLASKLGDAGKRRARSTFEASIYGSRVNDVYKAALEYRRALPHR